LRGFPSGTGESFGGSIPVVTAADDDQVRGNVYALLGHLLSAPPDATVLESLAAIAPAPEGETLLSASWQMLGDAAARATPESLRDEHTTLFIGLGRGEVVPYASWYLTGFLMEQPLARLRGDLKELGIERQDGVREPEDHAAALCDAMALLISGDDPAPVALQSQFFARHIEPWMGRFFRDLQQAASARFYRAVGQLGEQFIDVETRAFGMSIPAAGSQAPGLDA
jgi:TorA maturation chaperone TorD